MTATAYMEHIHNAAGTTLIDGHPLYSGVDGHKRLAREIGAGLSDFNETDRQTIMHASYSVIYVRSCWLRPELSAKDWIAEILKGYNDMLGRVKIRLLKGGTA